MKESFSSPTDVFPLTSDKIDQKTEPKRIMKQEPQTSLVSNLKGGSPDENSVSLDSEDFNTSNFRLMLANEKQQQMSPHLPL